VVNKGGEFQLNFGLGTTTTFNFNYLERTSQIGAFKGVINSPIPTFQELFHKICKKGKKKGKAMCVSWGLLNPCSFVMILKQCFNL